MGLGVALCTALCAALLFAAAVLFGGGGGGDGAGLTAAAVGPPTPPALLAAVKASGSICPVVTPGLIAAQIDQESGWNPNALSPAGAEGIAQFRPKTWPSWAPAGTSPFDATVAIVAMGTYDCASAKALSKLGGDVVSLVLAAYNAGLGAVERYGGVPPYPQTQHYVSRVEGLIGFYSSELARGVVP